ncbi:MAG TPA: SHOCT domain-containing protein, partial [Mycobacterium sp.]|nr:SHOCT domain-containing protein [Mycobacterium sp.]
EYQIDWERSALVAGVMPANFTIAEDNKTYDLSGQAGPLMEILQILKANGIGLNNMIDLRSNPAARAQVQAVVRRAAAAQQAPAASAPTPAPAGSYAAPPEPTTAQRLQELETLRATGAISDDEYNAKRQQILSDL